MAVLARYFPRSADDDRRRAMPAEYLAKQNRLGNAPRRGVGPARIVSPPWRTCDENDLGMREYLSFVSPAEFVQHGVFTDERPLRRA